ncbi:InlB B-repeat-containing protein [Candidatus Sumerlaeota bacterium]|nr:InlB B-repeat-containing protein [Candidatus Sumerlaeota bacterium]
MKNRVLHIVIAFIALVGGAVWAQPPTGELSPIPRQDTWVTDGEVYTIAPTTDTIYVGGWFSYVGPVTGGGVPVDSGTGQPLAVYPEVHGEVYSVLSDGAGGWYIGGWFWQVGEAERDNLAHILPDGTVDPTWDPGAGDPDLDEYVEDMILFGSTLYFGGNFSEVDGQPRQNLAAVDTTTGNVTAWNPGADGGIETMAWTGSSLLVGGWFANAGGASRSRLAELDLTSGTATAWDPNPNAAVFDIALSSPTVYVCGDFSTIGGQSRAYIAALDASSGLATDWNPGADLFVMSLAVSDDASTVYAGGAFSNIGGASRRYIAALDATTTSGTATAWDPGSDGGVNRFLVSGSTIYVGGEFWNIGGQQRNCLAALDATTGFATAWNPGTNNSVWALALSGSTLYVGGSFSSVGGATRNNIAAIDRRTGEATDWDPDADDDVYALAVSGSTVYVGGYFDEIGGQDRDCLAAIDASTGLATGWDPGVNDSFDDPSVYCLAVSGSTVYVGGYFDELGGEERDYLGAVDAVTGDATSWDPDPDDEVYAFALTSTTLFVGGDFEDFDDGSRDCLASFDLASGDLTAWDPDANDSVYVLAISGSTVYVGGRFTYVGGEDRDALAELDMTTGTATAWDPDPWEDGDEQEVYALALSRDGSTVYVGGYFEEIGGEERYCLAAIDGETGDALDWDPDPDDEVYALGVQGSALYVGGDFWDFDGERRDYFAEFGPKHTVVFQTDGMPGATLDGVTSQTVAHGDDCTTVTAVPPEDYQFYNWTLDGSDYSTANPLVVTDVIEDMLLTANFSPQSFEWDTITSPQLRLSPIPVTIAAKTPGDDTETGFTGTVELTGHFPDVTVGDGSAGTGVAPLMGLLSDARTQSIYTQSELGHARTLTALALNVDTFGPAPLSSFTIRVKHTPLVEYVDFTPGPLSRPYWEGPNSGWTTVYSQASTQIESSGWVWFEFSTPFDYNGTDSLFIDFTLNDGVPTSTALCFHADTAPAVRTAAWSKNDPVGDPLNWDGASPLSLPLQWVPDIRLRAEEIPVVPTESGAFVNGVWNGNVMLNQPVPPMFLRADDGAGHTGDSNVFEVLNAYVLDVGTMDCSVDRSPDQASYLPGTSVTLTAVPDTGYHFGFWSGDVPSGQETQNPVIVVMDDDKVVTATCAINQYAVNFQTDGAPGGTIDGATSQTVTHGSDCSAVTAAPPVGWHFVRWDKETGIPSPPPPPAPPSGAHRATANGGDTTTSNPLTVTNVTESQTWTAVFAAFTVAFQVGSMPGAMLEGELVQEVHAGGDCSPVKAIPPDGARFSRWTVGGVEYTTLNPVVVRNVTQNMVVVANFGPWSEYAGPVGVVNLTSDGLKVIDPVTQTLYGPYFGGQFGGSDPTLLDAVMTSDGRTALVSDFGDGQILFVDLSDPGDPQLDPTSVTLTFFAEDIALTPDDEYALVTDGGFSSRIAVIHVPTRTYLEDVVTTAPVLGADPPATTTLQHQAIAIAPDGETVMTIGWLQGYANAYRLNPATGAVAYVESFDLLPYYPINVAFSPDGNTAVVLSAGTDAPTTTTGGEAILFSVDAPGVVTPTGVANLPNCYTAAQSIAFSRLADDKAYCYVDRMEVSGDPPVFGDLIGQEIAVLDVTGPGQVSFSSTTIPLSNSMTWGQFFGVDTVAIDPLGRHLYVSNMSTMNSSPTLSVVDLQSNTETATLMAGYYADDGHGGFEWVVPMGVAFPPLGPFQVAFQTDGTSGATLEGDVLQTVAYGSNSTPVTAVAPWRMELRRWTEGGATYSTANPLTATNVISDMTLTAVLGPVSPIVEISRAGYTTDTLQVDKLLYNDRDYRFLATIPGNLEGRQYIRTLNDDKDIVAPAPGADFFTFRLNYPSTVYIALPDEMPVVPSWLDIWTPVTETLQTTDHTPRMLFAREFDAGMVALGYNREAGMKEGFSMYNVVVVPNPTAARDWVLYE